MTWLVFGLIAPLIGGALLLLGSVLSGDGPDATVQTLTRLANDPWEYVGTCYFIGFIPAAVAGGILGHLEKRQTASLVRSLGISALVSLVWAVFVISPFAPEAAVWFIAVGLVSSVPCWWLTRWLPTQRQRAADKPLIDELKGLAGIEREIVAYARSVGENHIWIDDSRSRWSDSLQRKGLIEVSHLDFETVHFRLHPAAWAFVNSSPDQFTPRLQWPSAPWLSKSDLVEEADRRLRELEARR
jgi:hypothetical protein